MLRRNSAVLSRTFQSAHPLVLALAISLLATATSYLAPAEYGTSAVGMIFLAGTFLFALPRDAKQPPSHFGLALGGLFESAPLDPARLVRESAKAILIATCLLALIIPPFALGFQLWYAPDVSFDWARAFHNPEGGSALLGLFNLTMTHLLVVALPEEAFFRGYLQTALDDRWKSRLRILGAPLGWSLIVSSALFALGHLATTPYAGRLAVFFPSLLFGFLRTKTGGIGASMVLHAQCNVLSATLGRGFALHD